MALKKRSLFLALIALFTLAVGLAVNYTAHGVIRAALVRVYQAVYTVADAIPPPYYWGALILIILLSAVRSLVGDEGWRTRQQPEAAGGRVAEWREWLEQAAQPTGAQLFYRWRVARNLARLACEAAAYQQGISPGEAERQLEDADMTLPPAIRFYFLASIRSRPARSRSWWGRLANERLASALDLDPAQIVGWIETQMEVSHDNRRP